MFLTCENRLNNLSIKKPSFLAVLKLVSVITIPGLLVSLVSIQGSFSYASSFSDDKSPVTEDHSSNVPISSAESVHNTETLELPPEVDTFVILIANEAHESWQDEKHKLITDSNAYYIPANLIIHEGTAITFLNADAPWDTPHPQTIEIVDKGTNDAVYSTGVLDYTDSSEPVVLSPGKYSVVNIKYEAKEGNILVVPNEDSKGITPEDRSTNENLIIGGFYTTTNQVEDIKDNDGGSHPGSLQYYREEFEKNGFTILSEYNFSYGECSYCPGGFWPDNKSGEHTLIIYRTEQLSLVQALDILERLVEDNVYI